MGQNCSLLVKEAQNKTTYEHTWFHIYPWTWRGFCMFYLHRDRSGECEEIWIGLSIAFSATNNGMSTILHTLRATCFFADSAIDRRHFHHGRLSFGQSSSLPCVHVCDDLVEWTPRHAAFLSDQPCIAQCDDSTLCCELTKILNEIYLPMKFHVDALHSFKVKLLTKKGQTDWRNDRRTDRRVDY